MKLALWQTTGMPGNLAANVAALDSTALVAAQAGAELLLCSECWLSGYNIGDAAAALAEDSLGPSAQRIASIAQKHRLAIAYGYVERDAANGLVYNSAQVIGPEGTRLSAYRKTHLFGEFERHTFRPGSSFTAPFEYGGWQIGLLVCYDVEYPEAVRSLKLMGAELILVPTALADEYSTVASVLLPARSMENQLYIAYCNHSGVENGMRFLGGSRVTGPDGATLAAGGSEDALIFAELPRERMGAVSSGNAYLEDRRPDLYGLLVASA